MKSNFFNPIHTFYIPVMGTGFTADAPLKVAPYGISSVISLVDDCLLEQLRKFYCEKFGEEYVPISAGEYDHRAKRITAYLNLVHKHSLKKFESIRNADFEDNEEIHRYFQFLPEDSQVKKTYQAMLGMTDPSGKKRTQDALRDQMQIGRVDVNIMTKIDNPLTHIHEQEKQDPEKFTSAMAALRGFAQSELDSAIVFSAGLNQKLYHYVAEFKDFYADAMGEMKKKVIIKVNDFRSALIQGKIFAKKGIWISAFRVESGLNCGGHAFSNGGRLLGPILEEFKTKQQTLMETLKTTYQKAVEKTGQPLVLDKLKTALQVQGGIGTAHEDRFLREQYQFHQTGWGSPFLLCQEIVGVDDTTLAQLQDAGEKEIDLSFVSPMSVKFNVLTTSTGEQMKRQRIQEGHPGAPCVKGYLKFNQEFGRPLCEASRTYQELKKEAILKSEISDEQKKNQLDRMLQKTCICYQLGNAILQKYKISEKDAELVEICPGPNLAYFSKKVTMKEMIDHIYGRINLLMREDRPHMFAKELMINVKEFFSIIRQKMDEGLTEKDKKELIEIKENLFVGIAYYRELIQNKIVCETEKMRERFREAVENMEDQIVEIVQEYPWLHEYAPAEA